MERLIRVSAPHYVAGMIVDPNDRILRAAPILGWSVGKSLFNVSKYLRSKGYQLEVL